MNLSLNFIDCLIVLVVVVSAGYAGWRGLIWETLTIFSWATASICCVYFGPYIIPLTKSLVGEGWLASLLGYVSVFLAIFIPFAFISHRFSEAVKHSPIGPLDRAGGVAFGVVRALVVLGLAYMAFTYFVPIRNHPTWLTQARLLPIVQNTADIMLTAVPNRPRDYTYLPQHDPQHQAPSETEQRAANSPENSPSHDPMAELIRKNEQANSVPKSATEPVQQKSAGKDKESYGAGDRQALEKLVETGGKR
jgi:membrane protein required for colicin V production